MTGIELSMTSVFSKKLCTFVELCNGINDLRSTLLRVLSAEINSF